MRAIATFDIGTTAVKGVLVNEHAQAVWTASREIPTFAEGDLREQNPEDWWEAFLLLSKQMLSRPHTEILAIVMSGQMQDLIPVDASLMPVRPAILYSDGRAAREAEEIAERVGMEEILRLTGNPFDGSISLPKMLYLKRHEPEAYDRTRAFLISSKDYLIARLTGVCAGDRTACSTAGAMDLMKGCWSPELLEAAGIDGRKLPTLYASHEKVGRVLPEAAAVTGYAEGTPVYAGAGDAGATSLASGLTGAGQYNINLGTSGWVATVSDRILKREGVFNLAAMPEGKIINVVPFLNGANGHRWLSVLFSGTSSPDYIRSEQDLAFSVPGANGVMALPYLVGERFPILDEHIRGAFVGLTPETTRGDLLRAMLEATAFSIRQGLEQMDTPPRQISLIGGGARVSVWCRILANVLNSPILVFGDAETLSDRAIAAAALIGEGLIPDYETFIDSLGEHGSTIYTPDPQHVGFYGKLYERYLGLYPLLRKW